jgi:hypothetical protein
MQWRMPSTRLNRERGLAPCPYTIAGHIDGAESADQVLVIWHARMVDASAQRWIWQRLG